MERRERSFIKNGKERKERKERNILLKRTDAQPWEYAQSDSSSEMNMLSQNPCIEWICWVRLLESNEYAESDSSSAMNMPSQTPRI